MAKESKETKHYLMTYFIGNGGVRSKDLKTWENITDLLSFPKDIRHGTTFAVNAQIVEGLKKLN